MTARLAAGEERTRLGDSTATDQALIDGIAHGDTEERFVAGVDVPIDGAFRLDGSTYVLEFHDGDLTVDPAGGGALAELNRDPNVHPRPRPGRSPRVGLPGPTPASKLLAGSTPRLLAARFTRLNVGGRGDA